MSSTLKLQIDLGASLHFTLALKVSNTARIKNDLRTKVSGTGGRFGVGCGLCSAAPSGIRLVNRIRIVSNFIKSLTMSPMRLEQRICLID
jgi:hypothetical protein